MANKDVEVVPTKAEKLTLLAAGLGRKKLTFGNRDDAPTFKRKMEDAYPKLKLCGGFDLLIKKRCYCLLSLLLQGTLFYFSGMALSGP